jgi:hypothetical protein
MNAKKTVRELRQTFKSGVTKFLPALYPLPHSVQAGIV